jgi:serine/threonine protein kinase
MAQGVGTDLGIPGYEDAHEVGRGGFAVVYRAWQPRFERHVAIKVISAALDETLRRRFEHECLAVGALSGHPNIVTVYELGLTGDDRPFIAMEFLEAGALGDHIDSQGPMPWSHVAEIIIKLAGALESAHLASVLHRDVKPENVLMSRFGEPKLADFGIARIDGKSETRSGLITASLAHAAPEILSGQRPTVASDLYSLASTMFTMLAGEAPYVRPNEESLAPLLARIATQPVPDLRPKGIPDALCATFERALAKDPTDRQSGALEFARNLQRVQAEIGMARTALPLAGEDREVVTSRSTRNLTPEPKYQNDELEHTQLQVVPLSVQPKRRAIRVTVGLLALAGIASAGAVIADSGDSGDSGDPPEEVSTDAGTAEEVVFEDDFAAPSSGWTQLEDDESVLAYSDGQYRMAVKVPAKFQHSDTELEGSAFKEDLTQLGDVAVEADATRVSAASGVYGLMCRYQGDDGPRYIGVVDDEGTWGIYKGTPLDFETGVLTTGRTPLPQLAPQERRRLRFECSGTDSEGPTTLRLFVDGRRLAEVEDTQPLGPGPVGLTVATREQPGLEVLFDNVVVTQPSDNT